MYGIIFTYIQNTFMVNVGTYSIHEAYGYCTLKSKLDFSLFIIYVVVMKIAEICFSPRSRMKDESMR